MGLRITEAAPKVPAMSQVLSSTHYICLRKTWDSTMEHHACFLSWAPSNLGAPLIYCLLIFCRKAVKFMICRARGLWASESDPSFTATDHADKYGNRSKISELSAARLQTCCILSLRYVFSQTCFPWPIPGKNGKTFERPKRPSHMTGALRFLNWQVLFGSPHSVYHFEQKRSQWVRPPENSSVCKNYNLNVGKNLWTISDWGPASQKNRNCIENVLY